MVNRASSQVKIKLTIWSFSNQQTLCSSQNCTLATLNPSNGRRHYIIGLCMLEVMNTPKFWTNLYFYACQELLNWWYNLCLSTDLMSGTFSRKHTWAHLQKQSRNKISKQDTFGSWYTVWSESTRGCSNNVKHRSSVKAIIGILFLRE